MAECFRAIHSLPVNHFDWRCHDRLFCVGPVDPPPSQRPEEQIGTGLDDTRKRGTGGIGQRAILGE